MVVPPIMKIMNTSKPLELHSWFEEQGNRWYYFHLTIASHVANCFSLCSVIRNHSFTFYWTIFIITQEVFFLMRTLSYLQVYLENYLCIPATNFTCSHSSICDSYHVFANFGPVYLSVMHISCGMWPQKIQAQQQCTEMHSSKIR